MVVPAEAGVEEAAAAVATDAAEDEAGPGVGGIAGCGLVSVARASVGCEALCTTSAVAFGSSAVPHTGAVCKGDVLAEGANAVPAGGAPTSDAVAAAAIGGGASCTKTTGWELAAAVVEASAPARANGPVAGRTTELLLDSSSEAVPCRSIAVAATAGG
jgi:hypothetical protein